MTTPEQMKWALAEIAHKADLARTLCNEAIAAPNEERDTAADLIAAAKAIVEQIGWIADHHNQPGFRGDAANWLLPPAYHEKSDS